MTVTLCGGGVLSGIYSDFCSWHLAFLLRILSAIFSDIHLLTFLLWPVWHLFWHSIWHAFSLLAWGSIWRVFWHATDRELRFRPVVAQAGWSSCLYTDIYVLPSHLPLVLTQVRASFWHMVWKSICHLFRRSIWRSIWHLASLANLDSVPTCFLGCCLAPILTPLRPFYFRFWLTFFL